MIVYCLPLFLSADLLTFFSFSIEELSFLVVSLSSRIKKRSVVLLNSIKHLYFNMCIKLHLNTIMLSFLIIENTQIWSIRLPLYYNSYCHCTGSCGWPFLKIMQSEIETVLRKEVVCSEKLSGKRKITDIHCIILLIILQLWP